MKKCLLALVAFVLVVTYADAAAPADSISILPEPVKMVRGEGYFTVPANPVVDLPSVPELKELAAEVTAKFSTATGYKAGLGGGGTIRFLLNKAADKSLGEEGYTLSVTPAGIRVSANKPVGLFYGFQTLLQLLPKEIDSKSAVSGVAWQVPVVEITDYPRFGWRGLMLDVSRHFFTKQEVMAFIDNMVRYKFNLLHMHLVDDEGWRVEIKSLPKLTTVGAYSVKKVGTFGTFSKPTPDEPKDYGGFYTQDDIRELVQYAKARFVNIMPEIDVPGHSAAAVASYPEISCNPGADTVRVVSGEHFMDWGPTGPIALEDNTLCPANEKAYAFLDKVFGELAKLFPFPYIHVGGDECPKNLWEKTPEIQALAQKQKLKSMQEVQAYFEKRVEKIVESKGKKVIGWDEILEGGLAPNALVMSWRGIKGGIEAAKQGHQVVMSPTTYVYLDYMNGDSIAEPPVYAILRLSKTYEFDPVPEGVDPKFILGAQGNLWTEQVYNTRHMQYMIWPRALAISESTWSPKEKKNWDWFVSKVERNFDRMDVQEIKYARSMYDAVFEPKAVDGKLQVSLSTEVKGLDIYYSFDNSFPDNFYPKYTGTLVVPEDASLLRVITYRDGKPIGRMLSMPVSVLRHRAGIQ